MAWSSCPTLPPPPSRPTRVQGKAVTREQAEDLLQRFCAPAASPTPALAPVLAGRGDACSAGAAAPQAGSPRSSMESEGAALPDRLRSALCSKLYAGACSARRSQ